MELPVTEDGREVMRNESGRGGSVIDFVFSWPTRSLRHFVLSFEGFRKILIFFFSEVVPQLRLAFLNF